MEVEGEEEEEEEEDDDDEGEEDDDEDQFQELEDAIYRFPLGDNGDDDLDLMIQYPGEESGGGGHGVGHNHIDERMARAIHLPLWSDMVHGMGGLGAPDQNGTGVSVGTNNHVSPNHPLLMGRQATNAALEAGSGSRTTSRGIARQLHRGFRGYFHLGSRGGQNATAPTILQSFLGSNTPQAQDIISHSLRRGTPLLVDFGYAILDSLENEVADIDNSVMGSGGRAALSTIPSALVRWNEESRVIDGDSMHDCVTALKPQILEVVEKAREEEAVQRKAKKKEEEQEKEKKAAADNAAAATAAAAAATAKNNEETTPTEATASADDAEEEEENTPTQPAATFDLDLAESADDAPQPQHEDVVASSTPNDTMSDPTAARMAEDLAAAISSHLRSSAASNEEQILLRTAAATTEAEPLPPPPPPFPTFPLPPANENMSIFVNQGEDDDDGHENSLPAALAPLSPSPEQSNLVTADRDVVMRSENASPQQQNREESSIVISQATGSALRTAGPAVVASEVTDDGNDPGAGPSGTSSNAAAASIHGMDVRDLPDGVDPSFLAALPEDMAMEVIEEQRRLQSIRARAAQNVEAGVTEVNPEFLAALPPNIQEEVLAQQRIEQQRQAAQQNPEAPVDPGEFLQTLPESLRQSVLADMEESQIPSLPADLAAEAQVLRREFEQQQRHR